MLCLVVSVQAVCFYRAASISSAWWVGRYLYKIKSFVLIAICTSRISCARYYLWSIVTLVYSFSVPLSCFLSGVLLPLGKKARDISGRCGLAARMPQSQSKCNTRNRTKRVADRTAMFLQLHQVLLRLWSAFHTVWISSYFGFVELEVCLEPKSCLSDQRAPILTPACKKHEKSPPFVLLLGWAKSSLCTLSTPRCVDNVIFRISRERADEVKVAGTITKHVVLSLRPAASFTGSIKYHHLQLLSNTVLQWPITNRTKYCQ